MVLDFKYRTAQSPPRHLNLAARAGAGAGADQRAPPACRTPPAGRGDGPATRGLHSASRRPPDRHLSQLPPAARCAEFSCAQRRTFYLILLLISGEPKSNNYLASSDMRASYNKQTGSGSFCHCKRFFFIIYSPPSPPIPKSSRRSAARSTAYPALRGVTCCAPARPPPPGQGEGLPPAGGSRPGPAAAVPSPADKGGGIPRAAATGRRRRVPSPSPSPSTPHPSRGRRGPLPPPPAPRAAPSPSGPARPAASPAAPVRPPPRPPSTLPGPAQLRGRRLDGGRAAHLGGCCPAGRAARWG